MRLAAGGHDDEGAGQLSSAGLKPWTHDLHPRGVGMAGQKQFNSRRVGHGLRNLHSKSGAPAQS